jgi:type II secretory pathway pseudopilin PulG
MIRKSFQTGQRGAMLLLLMVMVVVLGLAAGMAGQSWRTVMQREREAELLWRGQQYQQAIGSYYSVKQGASGMFPRKLEDLVRDPRFPKMVRHLRKLYKDPMTDEDWDLIKDPANGIIGVRSRSNQVPFRREGFPEGLEQLSWKNSYREWAFVYKPPKKRAAARKASGAPAPNSAAE